MSEPVTLDDLVAGATLTEVAFFELSASRQSVASDVPPDGEEVSEMDSQQTMFLDRRKDGRGFRVRLKTEVAPGNLGTIVAGVEGEWDTPTIDQSDVPEDVMLDYINGVAIMVLLPFTREAIADITRRVFGNALLLPVMQRGVINFTTLGRDPTPNH